MIKKIFHKKTTSDHLISQMVDLKMELDTLPPLSAPEKAKLDQDFAIDHLYYSSKLEGTNLSNKRIEQAIYGKIVSST